MFQKDKKMYIIECGDSSHTKIMRLYYLQVLSLIYYILAIFILFY